MYSMEISHYLTHSSFASSAWRIQTILPPGWFTRNCSKKMIGFDRKDPIHDYYKEYLIAAQPISPTAM